MLPPGFLKDCLDRLLRLAGRPWGRAGSAAFRPRLELLEPRAAPGGLTLTDAFPPPPATEPALFRVSEALAATDAAARARPRPRSRRGSRR